MQSFTLWVVCLITGFPFQKISKSDYGSKSKVITYAVGMIMIIMLNCISTYVFCTEVLHCKYLGAVIIVGIITFCFDRIIIHTEKNPWSSAFRIIVSFISAFIFSIGIDLGLSRDDIERKIHETRLKQSQLVEARVDSSFAPSSRLLKNELERQTRAFYINDSVAREELNHPGRPGDGKIYKAKRLEADKNKSNIDSLNSILTVLTDTIKAKKAKAINDFLMAPAGIWERIKALHNIVLSDGWQTFIWLILLTLFIALDLTVLFSKLFSKPTVFEHKQEVLKLLLMQQASTH